MKHAGIYYNGGPVKQMENKWRGKFGKNGIKGSMLIEVKISKS